MHTSSDCLSPCSSSQSGAISSLRPDGHSSRSSASHHGGPGARLNWVPARAACACCPWRVAIHAILGEGEIEGEGEGESGGVHKGEGEGELVVVMACCPTL